MHQNPKAERQSAVKGMRDILPPEIHVWQAVEGKAREVFTAYGYGEIKTPILEHTPVFERGIGETSDIVEKEMYTFKDKSDRSLTMRPEATASVVRCYVEHSLHNLPAPQKFYYMGPMFRYERPQKGRLRQFYQIGAEAFGAAEPLLDAEIIEMLMRFLKVSGISGLTAKLNSLGCADCRPAYKESLIGHLRGRLQYLCEDCRRRFDINPLRILDCKSASCIQARQDAPSVGDYLCPECRSHFDGVKRALDLTSASYVIDGTLVRGLDYYTRTVFEVQSSMLGAQSAVAAGGRYDGLVSQFGGAPTPAIGFAVGMERVSLLLSGADLQARKPDYYIVPIGDEALLKAMSVASSLRDGGFSVQMPYAGGSVKSQMKKADKSGALKVVIIGEQELQSGIVKVKDMADGSTMESGIDDIAGCKTL